MFTLFVCHAQMFCLTLWYSFSYCTEGFSPNSQQLKESMDLYEEIVTEEQQDKESSHTKVC